jgi:hypothetical protein
MAAQIAFAEKKLDVVLSADVAVCGGGPAGVAAAVAAARAGASVALLEQIGCLGGMGTAGLVPCFCPFTDGEKAVVRGIGEEVLKEMARRMGFKLEYDWMRINAEVLKTVYDDIVGASGAVLRLHTKVVDVIGGERVEAVVISTKSGLKAVAAKVFIDATGDGDVSAWAGVPFEVGDKHGKTMAPSLCPAFSGVDWAAFEAETKPGYRPDQLLWREAAERGTAPFAEMHLPVGLVKVGRTMGQGNLGHVYGEKALDEESLTRGMVEGRKMAWGFLEWYRANVPGFAGAEMAATAALFSVRETRRIMGDYVLSFDDYMKRASFDDEVGRLSYPIDIHSSSTDPDEQEKVQERYYGTALAAGESFGIPYRSLIARGKENLLVAGRCASTDREVQSSLRVMPGCFVTGQGAGAAAAIAAKSHEGRLREVEGGRLREMLKKQGAYIP